MDAISLKPERRVQVEEYARRHGKDASSALDDVLAAYLEWESEDYADAIEGIRRGHEDASAGRTQMYRILFTIENDVLHIRHGRQQRLTR